MTYNFDNINEFFEDLMNGKNAKLNMLRVYGAYERECEENKRKREIEEKYDWPGCNYIAHIVNDDIVIVEERKHGITIGYFAYVNDKKSQVLWPTFEQALLASVDVKMTGNFAATEWMWKLVGGGGYVHC